MHKIIDNIPAIIASMVTGIGVAIMHLSEDIQYAGLLLTAIGLLFFPVANMVVKMKSDFWRSFVIAVICSGLILLFALSIGWL